MRVFEKLRALREFERQHLPALATLEDHHLVHEIGYHQAKGEPLTLKQLFLLDAGSIATVQRRLRRLKHLGVIEQHRSAADRRAVELTLSAKYLRTFAKYGQVLANHAEPPSRHVCSPYDSDAARRRLAGAFLAHGLRRGELCLLIASAPTSETLLASLGERRKHVVASGGESSAEAQLAFFKHHFGAAKAAGRGIRVVGDAAWTEERGLSFDAVMDYEARLEPLVRQFHVQALCLYDARRFSAPALVRALKQHRDTARLPLLLA